MGRVGGVWGFWGVFGGVWGERRGRYLEARSPSRLAWVKGDDTLVTAPQGHATPPRHIVCPPPSLQSPRGVTDPITSHHGRGPILQKVPQDGEGGGERGLL